MYWDVVEVIPQQDYRLFVRFKDGLTGNVGLRLEELTGALAPLADPEFFRQVFIDCGAVAWPGEIDLAPDAMYADVASQYGLKPQAGPSKSHSELKPTFQD
jgi:hypothetical protein